MPPKRAFVFITGIPPAATEQDVKAQLRGEAEDMAVMSVILLRDPDESSSQNNYALALYASEATAISATKKTHVIGSHVLTLYAMAREGKRQCESTYQDTIEIEGKPIRKDALAISHGLQLALHGAAAPKWCSATREKRDCPLGTECHFIHLAEFQRSTKRLRDVEECTTNIELSELNFTKLSSIFPVEMLLPHAVVELSDGDVKFITNLENPSSDLFQRVEEAIIRVRSQFSCEGCFVRLNCPRGAPTDAPICDALRRSALLEAHPRPLNGLQTPHARDEYIRSFLPWCSRALCVASGPAALALCQQSPNICRKLEQTPCRTLVVTPWIPH